MKPTLLLMAAGLGSRFGGIKQMESVGVNGETLLDYSIYDAVRHCGFGKVVFITRPDLEADFRERLFDRIARNCDASYVFQTIDGLLTPSQALLAKDRTKPWGTLAAVLSARRAVDTPFMVINCDDWYGRNAFGTMGAYLGGLSSDSTCHAMVGYRLRNTMDAATKGTVARASCVIEDGMLLGMREAPKVEFAPGGFVSHLPEGDVRLSGDELVSMNLFGFAPSVFDCMEEYWNRFIADNASEPKAECLLPDFVGDMVSSGKASLKVFACEDRWFGMTYREDAATVRRNLSEKTAQGFYPAPLWKN